MIYSFMRVPLSESSMSVDQALCAPPLDIWIGFREDSPKDARFRQPATSILTRDVCPWAAEGG